MLIQTLFRPFYGLLTPDGQTEPVILDLGVDITRSGDNVLYGQSGVMHWTFKSFYEEIYIYLKQNKRKQEYKQKKNNPQQQP